MIFGNGLDLHLMQIIIIKITVVNIIYKNRINFNIITLDLYQKK